MRVVFALLGCMFHLQRAEVVGPLLRGTSAFQIPPPGPGLRPRAGPAQPLGGPAPAAAAAPTAAGATLASGSRQGPVAMAAEPSPAPERYVPDRDHLVFFDGQCGLCNGFVDFLLRRDKRQRLRYVPQQSDAALEVLQKAGYNATRRADGLLELPGVGNSVFILTPDGRMHTRSAAGLRAWTALGGKWRVLGRLALLAPRRLRDPVYNWISRNRFRFFGQEVRRPPTKEEQEFFLE